MSEKENHFTVFIRLPFKRGDFVDPPPVAWSASKERELWDIISRPSKGNEIDWSKLAAQFQVTQQFLLQQAAWLYERQLSQVRAQIRRIGGRQSATASPIPGSSTGSMIGTQPSTKKSAAPASRGPSRLSTQIPIVTAQGDSSTPNTPARIRNSLTFKSTTTGGNPSTARVQPTSSRPLSRKSSRDIESGSRIQSRRGSVQNMLSKSPGEIRSADLSSTSEEESMAKPNSRRPNQLSAQRRTSLSRKSQYYKSSSRSVHQLEEEREEENDEKDKEEEEGEEDDDDDDDEDDPAFLPFAASSAKDDNVSSNLSDPSATLRGGLARPQTQPQKQTQQVPSTCVPTPVRPLLQRNTTSERIQPTMTATTKTTGPAVTTTAIATGVSKKQNEPTSQTHYQTQLGSSNSSLSSNNAQPQSVSAQPAATIIASNRGGQSSTSPAQQAHPITTVSHRTTLHTVGNLPTPLSPRQQAALASAAGLSPRRRASANPSTGASQGGPPITLPGLSTTGHHHHHHQQQHGQHHTGYTGSESSPSMGSSFSDLDDASVTQSALEEALMSNMNAMGSTTTMAAAATAAAGIGGLGSRVSGISQALRSRYFDARSGTGSGGSTATPAPPPPPSSVAATTGGTTNAPPSVGGGNNNNNNNNNEQ